MKSSRPPQRKTELRSNPAGFVQRGRESSARALRGTRGRPHDGRDGWRDRRRWQEALAERCAACGTRDGGMFGLTLHHVCYRQHVKAEGGDKYDPRNGLTLCSDCHAEHHGRSRPLPLALLRDENYEFAFELLGPAAYDYLRRRYSGEGERLDALLERSEAA